MVKGQFNISDPEGRPKVFYEEIFRNRFFLEEDITRYLNDVKDKFDIGCAELEEGGFSIVSYNLVLCRNGMDWDTRIGEDIISGGFDLSVSAAKSCVNDFRNRYHNAIESMLEDVASSIVLNGEIYFCAFPSTERKRTLEGFFPENLSERKV